MREIHLKDHVLIAHSSIIEKEEYKWFKELLNSYDEINTQLVESLDVDKQNFFDNVVPLIKRQALNEWEVTAKDIVIKDLGEERQKCSICHTNIRYVCYIKNKINNNELQIGKNCAEHFGFNGNKSMKELIREAKRLRRITIIEQFIPGVDNIIQSWKEELNNYEVIIPTHLEKPYLELYEKIKKIYDDFLQEKLDNGCFDNIKGMLEQKNDLIRRMADYDKKYKGYTSIPKKEVKIWLRNNNMDNILTELKNNKTYTIKTIHRIKEPNFMNDIARKIESKILKPINGKIKKVIIEKYSYSYFFENNPHIHLIISHQSLLLEYGYILFGQEPVKELNKYNLLSLSEIMTLSYDSAINILNTLFKETVYSIYYYDIDSNEIYVNKDDNYYNYNLGKMIDYFKYALFNLDTNISISNYFSKFKVKPMPKIDVDEFINNR
ncbi:MAG: hypothetical protein ACOCRO_01430 [Halanaerobiales bacterium]